MKGVSVAALAKKHKNTALDAPVFVTLPYVKMTPEFIEAKDNGKHVWVQKSSVIKWELIDENLEPIMVKITMPLWYAQKRKFAYTRESWTSRLCDGLRNLTTFTRSAATCTFHWTDHVTGLLSSHGKFSSHDPPRRAR